MGYWSRKQTEQCWLFTRGRPARLGKDVRQIIEGPRREHSRKPDETYERIQKLVAGPYVEIFARQKYPGWDQWGGNQESLMPVGRVAPPPPVSGPLIDLMLR
jgi:N6-adenosine-specific RNA methylase IME4